MEEVINILGSLNAWLPYANLAAILMLVWSIQSLASKVQGIENDIDVLDRGVERTAGGLAQMAKRVYGKRKKDGK